MSYDEKMCKVCKRPIDIPAALGGAEVCGFCGRGLRRKAASRARRAAAKKKIKGIVGG